MHFHELNFSVAKISEPEARYMLMSVNDDLEDVRFVLVHVIYIRKAWSDTLWLG